MNTVMISGGFDPLHPGHVRLIGAAAKYGRVIVALNSDAWLRRKKGYVVQRWDERRELMASLLFIAGVDKVDDSDGTVCAALRAVKPTYFANGGDRDHADPREHAVCASLGIVELFGIGGGKIQSSSAIIERTRR